MPGCCRDPSRVLPLSARVTAFHGSARLLLLGVGLCACAGPRSGALVEADESSDPSTVAGEGSYVARIAGQPLTTAELLQAWLHRDSPGVRALLDQLIDLALARQCIRQIQPGELNLLRSMRRVHLLKKPIVKWTVILKLKRAQRMRDAFKSIRQSVRKIVHRVNTPLVASVLMRDVPNTI